MVIIHFACINDNKLDGVSVVVPEHVKNQGKHAEVLFINVNNIKIHDCNCQVSYTNNFLISKLPAPFNKPDLVIFHEIYRKQYISLAKQLYKLKIPYIIIPHGELNDQAQKKKALKKTVANFLIFRKIADRAVAIQCLSKREKEHTHFGRKSIVGTNGIYIPTVKKEYNKQDVLRCVYIGRLDPFQKGLDILLDAIYLIKDTVKDKMIFDIYGPEESDFYTKISSMIKEKELNRLVSLNHAVLGKEKERILLTSDVFIQTSRFEGMPMGLLEAMSYGLPCIVTEGTTLANYIDRHECGWTADTTSDSISQAILRMLSEMGDIERYGTNARKSMINDYSWEEIVVNTIDQYKELLKAQNRGDRNAII